ncbi:MAG: RluA family pseudouridine synthase [Planctomycetota bacterium]|nr:RluA family pseudouridine synthase [Planctomycetota bacterium]MDA1177783.1 RluA family pseudouridine synthase [Planctomycetota bacterium]
MTHKSMTVHERMPEPARRLVNLVQQLLRQGKSPAAHAIRDGLAYVNGTCVRKAEITLRPGDLLEIRLPPVKAPIVAQKSPFRQPLEIVYNDEHLMVVNKPPGLLTVPTPYKEKTTLISLVDRWIQAQESLGQAYCVHRLDRGVSGLLVFAKWLKIAELLRDQFEARKPQRRYVAIVDGLVKQKQGTFRSYIATDKKTLQRYSTQDTEAGQLAITHYSVLHSTSDTSAVEVRLETGRRNQIRVHFSEAGHPILGDVRYGASDERSTQWPFRRLALHAESLGFVHPMLRQPLEFHATVPTEFTRFMPK